MAFPLDSRQLKAFQVLAEMGSFTLAAKELHLTQSAISHSIKALERDVGCLLLHRVGKKAFLTQHGEHLLVRAKNILEEMSAGRAELEALNSWGSGRLRLSATPTTCQYVLPTVFREFRESFPDCKVEITAGDTAHSLDLLNQNKVDLAITLESLEMTGIHFRRLFTDELNFAVHPLHPWAKTGRVALEEIKSQKFILDNKGSLTFRLIEDHFKKQEWPLRSFIELGSMEAMKELVKIGAGVGILAPWIATTELDRGSIVCIPLGKTKLKRNWGISHWQRRQLNLQEETFVGLCQAVMDNLALI